MTTRRTALRLAGVTAGVAGAGALTAVAGCRFRSDDRSAGGEPASRDVLVVEVAGGALAVVDALTGRLLVNPAPAVLSGDGNRLIRADQPDGATGGTRLAAHRLPDGTAVGGGTLDDRLAVRVSSPDGSLVALADPGGTGGTTYRPGPRERTTIVVADGTGQRNRLELAGNLEPEAFDASGRQLFVLDYLPPAAPDRYRVRVVDLATGQVGPLLTRTKTAVPPGAEEEMRGEGRQAVYDWRTQRLFTLYTHQPDHLHTRDRIAGARPDAPHVHAFVHTLSLVEGWAYCVDLPTPFGERAAAGHTIALSRNGDTLYVADSGSGALAAVDPVGLTVARTLRFAAPAAPAGGGTASAPAGAAFDRAGMLLVGAGREVVGAAVTAGGGTDPRWSTPAEIRGLAGPPDGARLYVGQPDAVLRVDAGTGRVRQRIAVPGLVALRHVVARNS
ncbi:YncE family protein [Plantactinospora sp. CA-290183]|uniref:YncE family protein n=1 Tax=Plantactinospora sp. CA-290183 TaxID=3240006 RepID=UPI003D8F29DD